MDDKRRAAGIIPLAASTGRILLSLRPGWLEPSTGETWAGWGGSAHHGESPSETALRELYEETGYDGQITLFPCHLYQRPDQDFQYQNFIGVIPEEFEPHLNMENESAAWVTMSELYGGTAQELKLLPAFAECVIEIKPMLTEMIKGLGILNEMLLRDTVREIVAASTARPR